MRPFIEVPPAALDERPQTRSVFVTGTDTGVGKTVVTAAIARTLRQSGLRVAIFKPLQTGTIDGDDDARDAAHLSGCDAFTGVALADPLAPSVAAELAGRRDRRPGAPRPLRASCRRTTTLSSSKVPAGCSSRSTTRRRWPSWRASWRSRSSIVARPALGTLNHTALTVEVARARGLDVAGVVISRFPESRSSPNGRTRRDREAVRRARSSVSSRGWRRSTR